MGNGPSWHYVTDTVGDESFTYREAIRDPRYDDTVTPDPDPFTPDARASSPGGRKVDVLRKSLEITRNLAKRPAPFDDFGGWCSLCCEDQLGGHERERRGRDDELGDHASDCPWRQARELFPQSPQEGTQHG